MAVLHQCGNGHWMDSLDSECVCKELWIARINHQHLKTAGKDHYLEKRDGVPQKERETYGQKEREKGMQCYMKKKDNSLIYV